jgi:hypothetical protein
VGIEGAEDIDGSDEVELEAVATAVFVEFSDSLSIQNSGWSTRTNLKRRNRLQALDSLAESEEGLRLPRLIYLASLWPVMAEGKDVVHLIVE